MKLWQWEESPRGGTLESLFVASEDDVALLVGSVVYLGEVLGKHSDVTVMIEKGDIEEVKLDAATVATITGLLGKVWSGIDLLGAYHDQHEDEDEDEA